MDGMVESLDMCLPLFLALRFVCVSRLIRPSFSSRHLGLLTSFFRLHLGPYSVLCVWLVSYSPVYPREFETRPQTQAMKLSLARCGRFGGGEQVPFENVEEEWDRTWMDSLIHPITSSPKLDKLL